MEACARFDWLVHFEGTQSHVYSKRRSSAIQNATTIADWRQFHSDPHLQGSAIGDGDLGGWLACRASFRLNKLDQVKALDNFAKHNMLAVEPAMNEEGWSRIF